MDARISAIRDEANKILGPHCIQKCNALCCKRYSLVLSEKEMNAVVGDKEKALRAAGKLKQRMGGGWLLNIDGGCPALDKNNQCTVYMQPPRSKARCFSCGMREVWAAACSIMPTPERAEGERETPRALARGWCRHYFYKNRPFVCRNAPFVFDEEYKMVKVGCGCSAVTSGLLNPFFKRFEESGWKVFIATDEELGAKLTRWKPTTTS